MKAAGVYRLLLGGEPYCFAAFELTENCVDDGVLYFHHLSA